MKGYLERLLQYTPIYLFPSPELAYSQDSRNQLRHITIELQSLLDAVEQLMILKKIPLIARRSRSRYPLLSIMTRDNIMINYELFVLLNSMDEDFIVYSLMYFNTESDDI